MGTLALCHPRHSIGALLAFQAGQHLPFHLLCLCGAAGDLLTQGGSRKVPVRPGVLQQLRAPGMGLYQAQTVGANGGTGEDLSSHGQQLLILSEVVSWVFLEYSRVASP